MLSIRNLRRWWQVKTGKVDTPIDGGVPFWIFSLVFHLLIIIFLAGIIMPSEDEPTVNLTVAEPIEELEEDDIISELQFDDLSEEIGADGDDGFEAAADQAQVVDVAFEDPVDLQLPEYEVGEIVTDTDFFEATSENLSSVAVKGNVGNSVSAASGAVDRMTQEILQSMEERNTVVIWLFDQSASLMLQREEILSRFDRIYEELGIVQAAGHQSFDSKLGKPLTTQVYAFGNKISKLIENPTDSLATIKEAIENIERDSTGIENVMEAVATAAKDHQSFRKIDRSTGQPKANVMLIVVSDEAGDDVQHLDQTVQACTKLQMPVYVIGVPAPFGRLETRVKWVDPDPQFDQKPQWAIVSQGPESIYPERLQLDFTGTFDDLDMIDSGFGPFHLTRLAYETGGIYFAVHPNRTTSRRVRRRETESYSAHLQYFFDPKVMKRYRPDYVSIGSYKSGLAKNGARAALVRAAQFSTTGQLETPDLRFVKTDEARFVNSVSKAQQGAAIIEPAVNRLYDILRAGEEARDEETSPRWQAGYDLAMGRAIAAKVRAETYNSMLALIKTKLKFDKPKDKDTPQNNTWVLEPADSIATGSQDAKLLAKARKYLERVTQEHEGTPWAMLADRELQTPLGWKWSQEYNAPRERNNKGNNNNDPEKDDEQMKKKRPPPRL